MDANGLPIRDSLLVLHMGIKPDVSKAKRNLSMVGKNLARAMERRALRQGGKIVQREMKESAPVESGRLKKSIKVRAGRRSRLRQSITVRATVPYGMKIEELYGFASIAENDSRPQVITVVQDTINSELQNL